MFYLYFFFYMEAFFLLYFRSNWSQIIEPFLIDTFCIVLQLKIELVKPGIRSKAGYESKPENANGHVNSLTFSWFLYYQ